MKTTWRQSSTDGELRSTARLDASATRTQDDSARADAARRTDCMAGLRAREHQQADRPRARSHAAGPMNTYIRTQCPGCARCLFWTQQAWQHEWLRTMMMVAPKLLRACGLSVGTVCYTACPVP